MYLKVCGLPSKKTKFITIVFTIIHHYSPLFSIDHEATYTQVHGGDWGAIVGDLLTYIYPESVIGLHVTFNLSRFGMKLREFSQLLSIFRTLTAKYIYVRLSN